MMIDYGKCIEKGHDMVFDRIEYGVRTCLGVGHSFHRVVVKKCSRCGYESKEQATRKELKAIKVLGIDTSMNGEMTVDYIGSADCPPMPKVKPPLTSEDKEDV